MFVVFVLPLFLSAVQWNRDYRWLFLLGQSTPLNLLPGQVLLGRRLHSGCGPSSYGVPDNTSFRALLGLDPAERFSPCPLAFLVVVGWDTEIRGLKTQLPAALFINLIYVRTWRSGARNSISKMRKLRPREVQLLADQQWD